MSKFTISSSGLRQFYSGCPARYVFYSSLNVVSIPRYYELGLTVHRYMEEGVPDEPEDKEAADLARRLREKVEQEGYTLLYRELSHLAPLTSGIDVSGIVDVIALDRRGERVLIDYKTAGSPWKYITRAEGGSTHVMPQAETWQAEIYLTPPYRPPREFNQWPTRIDFMVVPKDGSPVTIHPYRSTDEGRTSLIRACQMVRDAERNPPIPKNKGWLCHRCDWMDVCWDRPGWETKFTLRDKVASDEVDPNGILAPDASGYIQMRMEDYDEAE